MPDDRADGGTVFAQREVNLHAFQDAHVVRPRHHVLLLQNAAAAHTCEQSPFRSWQTCRIPIDEIE